MKFKIIVAILFFCLDHICSYGQATPPAPNLTGNCAGAILPYTLNGGSANITVAGLPVTASFSDYAGITHFSFQIQTYCGISTPPANEFGIGNNNTSSSMKILFDKRVSNVLVYIMRADSAEHISFTLKDGCDTVHPTIAMATQTGNCNSNFTINPATNTVTNNVSYNALLPSGIIVQNAPSYIIVNFGGVWFDEIIVSKPAPTPLEPQGNGISLSFCIGAATATPGPPPSSSTTFLSLCANQLPTTWNGITIPAGATSNPAFTTYATTNAAGCDSI
ncbi:MAG: hypothetical protein WC756_21910, partial [Taibaiella sp.]